VFFFLSASLRKLNSKVSFCSHPNSLFPHDQVLIPLGFLVCLILAIYPHDLIHPRTIPLLSFFLSFLSHAGLIFFPQISFSYFVLPLFYFSLFDQSAFGSFPWHRLPVVTFRFATASKIALGIFGQMLSSWCTLRSLRGRICTRRFIRLTRYTFKLHSDRRSLLYPLGRRHTLF